MAPRKTRQKAEFGDFQTPERLAADVCGLPAKRGLRPKSILEPTCGLGSLLIAALERFETAETTLALDINEKHVAALRDKIAQGPHARRTEVRHGDFFTTDWRRILDSLPSPVLVIGNPPWVTNAELGLLGSSNLPEKSNFQNHNGFDALTGKSNFDISEWMLLHLLQWLDGRRATLAMLCKTGVARKALTHSWKTGVHLKASAMYRIDAQRFFGAAVDACLLVSTTEPHAKNRHCEVFESIDEETPSALIGYQDYQLVADVRAYERLKHLQVRGQSEPYRWRSGIKHDCSKVMELRKSGEEYENTLHGRADLEDTFLYPMLKSSDLANGATEPRRWMLVTQKNVGEDTVAIEQLAPKTWKYLLKYEELLDRRRSSIYKKRPRFSVFGVGDYSFANWKVAISGFYKKLLFKVVGPYQGKPVVMDDTAYFLSCETRGEADYLASLLNSDTARAFFNSFVFWDAKRPITIELLKRLDLAALARELGTEDGAKLRTRTRLALELQW